MTSTANRSSCASAAIAAVLALVSTPALAQDATASSDPLSSTATAPSAAPVTVSPTQAPAQTAPRIVIPDPAQVMATTTAAPASDAPVVQSDPQVATIAAAASSVDNPSETAAAAPAPTPRARTASTTARSSAAVTTPSVAAPVAAPNVASPAAPASPMAASNQPAAPRADTSAPAPAASTSSRTVDWALPVGLIALLGVGGAAVVAARRRPVYTDDDSYETSTVEMVLPPAPARHEPMMARDAAATLAAEPTIPADAPVYRPAMAATAEPMLDRDGPVPQGEERRALIDRMVAAAPDEANPFKSPKGRARRARLILQAQENRWNAEHGTVEAPVAAETRPAMAEPGYARTAPARKPQAPAFPTRPLRPAYS